MTQDTPPRVEIKGLVKRFGTLLANDHVDIHVHAGEILAILGENGAGKSTLMNCLYGILSPDAGMIAVNGQATEIRNPMLATALGIGMVHQHFKLVEPLTVAQNIVMGREPKRWGFLQDNRSAERTIAELSRTYGLSVDPQAPVSQISVGMQQRVEILKALYRGAETLILDEPTAVLTPQEIEELGVIIRNLASQGKSIILITHKLKEIKALADRCTIMRRGKVVGEVLVPETSLEQLAELMVGRKVQLQLEKKDLEKGEPRLVLKNISCRNRRNLPALAQLHLEVHAGEILGIAGVEGNGQSEIMELLSGTLTPDSGDILFQASGKEHSVLGLGPRQRRALGMSFIPEDRIRRGLVGPFTLAENMALENYYQEPASRKGILNAAAMAQRAQSLIEAFDIRPPEVNYPAKALSGGNQQKVILAREISKNPALIVASQPTRGLDVGAIEFVHRALLEERSKGCALLLISLELDEIMALSDRVAVLYEGRIAGIFTPPYDENRLGLAMAGGHNHDH